MEGLTDFSPFSRAQFLPHLWLADGHMAQSYTPLKSCAVLLSVLLPMPQISWHNIGPRRSGAGFGEAGHSLTAVIHNQLLLALQHSSAPPCANTGVTVVIGTVSIGSRTIRFYNNKVLGQ